VVRPKADAGAEDVGETGGDNTFRVFLKIFLFARSPASAIELLPSLLKIVKDTPSKIP